ncbi:MAG: hypothetical protein E6K59_06175, partial [Nitrospirae bacterium]
MGRRVLSLCVHLCHNPAMNFCSHCGSPVSRKVPPGDTLPR